MTEKRAVARLVREAKRALAPAGVLTYDSDRLSVNVGRPAAKVLLKRPFRNAAYIRRHVASVLKQDAERGEQHILRNLLCIRRNPEDMAVDQDVIDQEIRSIEAAVRAELWRQILLPNGET
jgi:hypothetical protein